MKTPVRMTPLITVFFAFSTALPLMAQRNISYRLTAFGMGKVPKLNLINVPGSEESFSASKGTVSLPIRAKLRDDTFLDFYREGTPAPFENAEPLQPLCSVKIPAGATNDLLVILIHDKDKILNRVIDFRRKGVKDGDQYLISFLKTRLKVDFEADGKTVGQAHIIKPMGSKNLGSPPRNKTLRRFYFEHPKTKRSHKFKSALCLKDDRAREIIFCYAKKEAKEPTLESINVYAVNGNARGGGGGG